MAWLTERGAQNPVLAQSGSLDVSYSPTRTDDLGEKVDRMIDMVSTDRVTHLQSMPVGLGQSAVGGSENDPPGDDGSSTGIGKGSRINIYE